MQYCRELRFTSDPDYRFILGLFEGCMERHNYDVKNPDFIWNKNRLFLEKEALKQNMMRVISKPTNPKEDGEEKAEED
jgi:hypothetical protein